MRVTNYLLSGVILQVIAAGLNRWKTPMAFFGNDE